VRGGGRAGRAAGLVRTGLTVSDLYVWSDRFDSVGRFGSSDLGWMTRIRSDSCVVLLWWPCA
jgi:hypothetical protein